MISKSVQYVVSSFPRAFLSFAVVALALSVLSVSRFTPQSRAQKAQKMPPAPAAEGASGAPSIVYPETKKGETVDDYFGTKVADPYRWLEGDASAPPRLPPGLRRKTKSPSPISRRFLFAQKIKERLTQLYNYPQLLRACAPRRIFLLHEERRPAEPERVVPAKRSGRHARSFARSQTNCPPTARRAWARSRFRRTESISATASRKAARTGTTFT